MKIDDYVTSTPQSIEDVSGSLDLLVAGSEKVFILGEDEQIASVLLSANDFLSLQGMIEYLQDPDKARDLNEIAETLKRGERTGLTEW